MPDRSVEPLTESRRPTHVWEPEAAATRCGIKMNSKDRFPYVGAEHVAVHVEGWGMVVCEACRA